MNQTERIARAIAGARYDSEHRDGAVGRLATREQYIEAGWRQSYVAATAAIEAMDEDKRQRQQDELRELHDTAVMDWSAGTLQER